MTNYEQFDAYTGLTFLEKSKLVDFLWENMENGHFTRSEIMEMVECAIKERASLGGYILTLKKGEHLLGAIVVNRTNSQQVQNLSLLAIAAPYRHNGVAQKLITHAIKKSGGGLSLQIEPGNKEEAFFEGLGFEKKYVVMQVS